MGNCGASKSEKETSIRYHSDQSDQKKFNVAVEKNASLPEFFTGLFFT